MYDSRRGHQRLDEACSQHFAIVPAPEYIRNRALAAQPRQQQVVPADRFFSCIAYPEQCGNHSRNKSITDQVARCRPLCSSHSFQLCALDL